jgi:TolB-like protein/Flp pilus assembly protein TadD
MCLVEKAGQVVTRDEILRQVWGERAFTDEPLTRCIGDLRRELGDSREEPRYVQTIPKRGYRLIARITPIHPPKPVAELDPAEAVAPGSRFAAYRPHAAVLSGLVIVGLAIAFLYPAQNVVDDAAQERHSKDSIAVLPFEDMSPDSDNAWMGRGISEDLLNLLALIDGMEVASRTSSFRPSLQTMDIREIGTELNVHYLLEGSVRRNEDRLKVAAQLIDAHTGYHLWSEVYDRRASDVFTIQTEIAERVVKALKLATPIGLASEAFARSTNSVDAYDYYLQARSFLNGPTTEETISNAVRFYERALEFDPEFGEAHAGLCSARLKAFGDHQAPDSMSAIRQACDAAVRFAPDSPMTHTAIGTLHRISGELQLAEDEFIRVIERFPVHTEARVGLALVYADRGDLDAADRTYREAIEVGPSDPRAYSFYCLFLWTNGRSAEAIPMCRRVIQLEPGSAQAYSNLGIAYGVAGDFEQAAAAYREAVARKPSSLAYSNIGINYYYLGRYEDAVVMFREATKLAPRNFTLWGNLGDALVQLPGSELEAADAYREARSLAELELDINPDQNLTLAALAHYCARLGDYACARNRLEASLAAESTEFYKYYFAALVYIQLDEYQQAVEETMRAVELGFPLEMLEAEPLLEPVRGNERLALLMQEEAKNSR